MSNLHNQPAAVQAVFRMRQQLANLSLQSRFLLIMGVSSLFFILLIWTMFSNFTEQFVERFGASFAEKQVLYDKARTLQPLIREIALAQQAADNLLLRKWAGNEQDPQLRQNSIALMEKLRGHFSSGNYFVALVKSGNLYYNDAEGQYEGRQLRYTLSPADPADAWFFNFISSNGEQRVRVAANDKLGVNKVWVRTPIRDEGKIVGMLGTGIDLGEFTQNVSNIYQPGITNMFINRNATIQIYNDIGHVDFPGVFNFSNHQHSTEQILAEDSNREWVPHAIKELNSHPVVTEFVRIQGKRYLAGMIALPEVGWYDLTLLDLSVLLPRTDFMQIWLAFAAGMLGLLTVLALSLHRLVLRPVATLTAAANRVRHGDYSQETLDEGSGEVRKLTSQFQDMAHAIHNNQQQLEAEIEKRTYQLMDAKRMLEISLQHEREGRETQANLMALMAHEMRSPVAVISNTAQMLNVLAQSNHLDDWQARVAKILRSVKQLASLMDNFLTEKWLDMDRQGLNREIGDLNQLCKEVSASFTESHNHHIRFEPWSGDALVRADWSLIRIAVINLLDNACKYSSREDEIGLRILPHKAGMLCIEVYDQGIGIKPEIQDIIFNRFVRGQKESDVHGSGLGLYLVNWIARFHGGYTEVLSEEGQGSTFRLYLPIHQ